MHLSNFSIVTDMKAHGSYIALNAHDIEWDLHNYADFDGFDYSTEITNFSTFTLKWHIRPLVLEWRDAETIPTTPVVPIFPSHSFALVFSDVDYLEVSPRDPEMPSDEDKTLSNVYYLEASESSEWYRETEAFAVYNLLEETLYHMVFWFRGGQFIRVGAKTAEFKLTTEARWR